MMWHQVQNATIRDRIHIIIKNFEAALPDHFEKTGLVKCGECDGSGLPAQINKETGVTFWSPGQFCTHCKGLGYLGVDRIYNNYLCSGCDGNGCGKCNGKGVVDWIQHARGE